MLFRSPGPIDTEIYTEENTLSLHDALPFSVYVPSRVEPMLPPELSNGACSLRQDHDRRAVTVELRFDASLQPGEPRFQRTLIRSDARLDYTEAHAILEGARTTRSASVVETLRLADRVSAELRRRRFAPWAAGSAAEHRSLAPGGRARRV